MKLQSVASILFVRAASSGAASATTESIASVEVKRWTAEGMLHAVRKWESVASGLENLAEEIARFVAESEIEAKAVVLAPREAG